MEGRATVHCRQCCESIASDDSFPCFKAPGKETYEFFHCRFRPGDCWNGHLRRRSNTRRATSKTTYRR